jgi:beta-lactamase regulating signal transducer with metallopeptidase domain
MTELSLIAKVTIVLAAVLIAVRVAKRASASCRALVLASAFCVVLALPIASAALSPLVVNVPLLASAPSSGGPQGVAQPTIENIDTGIQGSLRPRAVTRQAEASLAPALWLRAAWLLGSMLLLGPMAATLWRMRRMRSTAIRWPDGEALVNMLAHDAGVSRTIGTVLHEDARAPLTIGWVRPAIVLPVETLTWSDGDIRRALVHEIEHIRRCDWPVHMLARVTCAIYWFHPLVWIAWRWFRLDCERACDDGVLQYADAAAYAEQLLLLARRLSGSSAVGLFMASRTDLTVRIAAVLDSSQRRNRPGVLSTIAIAASVIVLLLAIAPVTPVRASAASHGAGGVNAVLNGNLFDPFGDAVENVKLYLERIGGLESYQGRTDYRGHFAFDAVHAGTYRLAAPMDFVPPTTIALAPGDTVQRDIRMEIETLTDAFTVCADCPDQIDTYVPPDSLVAEFQRDRQASWHQPVRGPEPIGGWESYWSRMPEYPPALREAQLEGTVIVEGRIGSDGFAAGLRVVSDVHPALASAALEAVRAERWDPGRIRGVAIEVPLRMTIDYILHARHR